MLLPTTSGLCTFISCTALGLLVSEFVAQLSKLFHFTGFTEGFIVRGGSGVIQRGQERGFIFHSHLLGGAGGDSLRLTSLADTL